MLDLIYHMILKFVMFEILILAYKKFRICCYACNVEFMDT